MPRRPGRPTTARATQPRSARRRAQLVRAGSELLGLHGWAGVTARAVADRARTHPGLVHYHFGGLPGLKREVAATAARGAIEPIIEVITAAPSWSAGLAAAIRAGAAPQDPATGRISAELVTAALRDDDVADLMRGVLVDARARVASWLRRTGASEPDGLATLIIAALDGLMLHGLIDPALRLDSVASAAERLARSKPARATAPATAGSGSRRRGGTSVRRR